MLKMKKWHYAVGIISTIIFLFLFFLSTFLKSYFNNHSEELTGRKALLKELHINYFKFTVRLRDLHVYEANGVDQFAGFKEFYINYSPWKLVDNEYSLSQIKLDSFYVYVIKEGDAFNFSDLIPVEDTLNVNEADTSATSDVRFSLYNIDFTGGQINFVDRDAASQFQLDSLNLSLPLIAWNNEQSEVGVAFEFGQSGRVAIDAEYDHDSERYQVALNVDSIDLNPITNYLKDFMAIQSLQGYLHSSTQIVGSSADVMNVVCRGKSQISSFSITDSDGEPFASFNEMSVELDSLDLKNSSYCIQKVHVSQPVIHAVLDKKMTNIERIFQPLLLADSTKVDSTQVPVTEQDVESGTLYYKIDTLLVTNGKLAFSDLTLNRPFLYDFKEISVQMKDLASSMDSIPVNYSVNLNDQGHVKGQLALSMLEPLKFHLTTDVTKLKMLSFSPYTEFFIGRPITQGEFNYNLSLEMSPNQMYNTNDFRVTELEFGDKTGDTTATSVPIRFALYLLKDAQNVIQFDLPVSGNPSDPEFSVSKIIWKTLKNFLIKTAASPFSALGSLVGTNPEELEYLPLQYAQDSLSLEQTKLLDKIAELLQKKSQLHFSFNQFTNTNVEKQYLAIELSKQHYISSLIDEQLRDSVKFKKEMEQIRLNDKAFQSYIYKLTPEMSDSANFTTVCEDFIGVEKIEADFQKLLNDRNQLINEYLVLFRNIDSSRITVATADLRNMPEQLKEVGYKIEVSID